MLKNTNYDVNTDFGTNVGLHLNNPMEPTQKQREFIEDRCPDINMESVKIIGNECGTYNCIAWSLGITYTWINPNNALDSFESLYFTAANYVHKNEFGPVWKASCNWKALPALSPEANIDGWGIIYDKEIDMVHAARTFANNTFPNPVWTSKLGVHELITHNRDGLRDKKFYGQVRVSFNQLINNEILDEISERHFEAIDTSFFTEEENNILIQKVETLNPEIGKKFLLAYKTWIDAIYEKIPFSSNTRDGAKLEEFKVFIDMGVEILPHVVLLMSSDPLKNFRALIIYDALQKNDKLKIIYGPDDPNQLEGEASRAARSAKLWIFNELLQ